MAHHTFTPISAPAHSPARTATSHARPTLRARLTARLRASRLDTQLAVGVPAPAESALAAHAVRLSSRRERDNIAHILEIVVSDARDRSALLTRRVPVHHRNVIAAQLLIAQIVERLQGPGPVGVRGVARLRRVLSDGQGPLYRCGRGDLAGRLGAVLAEL